MATNISLDEHRFLLSAEKDIMNYGTTDKRCPRCGNEIIIEEKGSSYLVRCKTDDCICYVFS